jgi:hypothetical protein
MSEALRIADERTIEEIAVVRDNGRSEPKKNHDAEKAADSGSVATGGVRFLATETSTPGRKKSAGGDASRSSSSRSASTEMREIDGPRQGSTEPADTGDTTKMAATTSGRGAHHSGASAKEAVIADDPTKTTVTKKITAEQYRQRGTTSKIGDADYTTSNEVQGRSAGRPSLEERMAAMAGRFGELPAEATAPTGRPTAPKEGRTPDAPPSTVVTSKATSKGSVEAKTSGSKSRPAEDTVHKPRVEKTKKTPETKIQSLPSTSTTSKAVAAKGQRKKQPQEAGASGEKGTEATTKGSKPKKDLPVPEEIDESREGKTVASKSRAAATETATSKKGSRDTTTPAKKGKTTNMMTAVVKMVKMKEAEVAKKTPVDSTDPAKKKMEKRIGHSEEADATQGKGAGGAKNASGETDPKTKSGAGPSSTGESSRAKGQEVDSTPATARTSGATSSELTQAEVTFREDLRRRCLQRDAMRTKVQELQIEHGQLMTQVKAIESEIQQRTDEANKMDEEIHAGEKRYAESALMIAKMLASVWEKKD